VAFPCGSGRKGEATIEVLGLNRPALVETRRDRLALLKALLAARDCLQKVIAVRGMRPPPELVAELTRIDARLAAVRQDPAEFAAMVRCLLA
jgi:hypothetical protein